jgi:putative inorganic carbon (HCO3(-)) transporter
LYSIQKVGVLKRSDFIARAVVTILFSYALAVGATFNGLLSPEFHQPTLLLIAGFLAAWLFIRWRRGWRWFRPPLETAIVVWALAFGLSLVGNPEVWRRVAVGLWYMALYILVWYALHDVLANGGLRRDILVSGILISGFVVLIFGYVQLFVWSRIYLPAITAGLAPLNLPRLVSTLGNANALGNYLVVLIPFALVGWTNAANRLGRVVMTGYALLALALLLLTFSRGAWVGMGAGLLVWGALWLVRRNLLSADAIRSWWGDQASWLKLVSVAGGAAIAIIIALIVNVFIGSFQLGGRGTELRTGIYGAAVQLFTEKPLTGYGLFTFGRELPRFESSPPNNPHSHAHSAPLHIAAELGLLGLAAMLLTVLVSAQAMHRNWRVSGDERRALLAGATAGVLAFAVHQLTDLPAMMPAIALSGLVALALATASPGPVVEVQRWRARVYPVGAAIAGIALVAAGWWNSSVYQQYVETLRYGAESRDYRGAAERLQPILEADPGLSLYHQQQGFLWGMAALPGDADSLGRAIGAYARFTTLEPNYAVGWANLSALYQQAGQQGDAYQAIQKAARLAPLSWEIQVTLARYAQALGEAEIARQAYAQALKAYPDMALHPELASLQKRADGNPPDLTSPAQIALLLDAGSITDADKLWSQTAPDKTIRSYVVGELLALARRDRNSAADWLTKIERAAAAPAEQVWLHLARARLARYDGDTAAVQNELAAAQKLLQRDPLDGDWEYGLSFAYAQFLRLGIPRQFLPQLNLPAGEPLLAFLLAKT